MADVYVTSWQEFLQAILVSGDTVHCPENAIWDMNNIEPDGHVGAIRFDCDNVYGHNTTIKNLKYDGQIIFKNGFVEISDLHWENMLVNTGTYDKKVIFLREGTWSSESDLVLMTLCKISGFFTKDDASSIYCEQLISKGIKHYRCGFNVESASHGRFNLPTLMEYCNFLAQLPDVRQIDANVTSEGRINYRFSNIVIVGANITSDASFYGAVCSVFRGRKERLTGFSNASGGYPSLYCTDDMPAVTEPGTGFIGVTESQLRDASYLQSIGFPIGV